MLLCVCKCLNVTLESDKIDQNVDSEKLELSAMEQRDIFFSEKLALSNGSLKISIAQQALVGQRSVGRWTVHTCLSCGLNTHASLENNPNLVVIAKELLTTPERVNGLKKSTNFSPVFNILVPEVSGDIEMKENINTSNTYSDNKCWGSAQGALSSLGKQLRQTLQERLEHVEEAIRQFRDQKYSEFEAYREKAQRDHNILASIISAARGGAEAEGRRRDAGEDNGPHSPHLPPLQRRRLSSIKDAKKITQFKQPARILPPEEDSLDAEDIFDLEGDYAGPDMGSDQDDYDSDSSNDEGIHIGRARGGASAADIARSLPINMPALPGQRPDADTELDEEPHDIAASIKALAKSVHGDVFELPRPRFSNQI